MREKTRKKGVGFDLFIQKGFRDDCSKRIGKVDNAEEGCKKILEGWDRQKGIEVVELHFCQILP